EAVRPQVAEAAERLEQKERELNGMSTGGAGRTEEGQRRMEELRKEVAGLRADLQKQKRAKEQPWIAQLTRTQEIGGLTGRVVLAVLAVFIVGRRLLLALYLVPLLLLAPYVFAVLGTGDYDALRIGVFAVAALTIGQISFWGNYLPRVFPLHL